MGLGQLLVLRRRVSLSSPLYSVEDRARPICEKSPLARQLDSRPTLSYASEGNITAQRIGALEACILTLPA